MAYDPENNMNVASMMFEFGLDEEMSKFCLHLMRDAFNVGHRVGQAEAQRFFRLALGVDVPEVDERALWNNPVPLKEEDDG